ncbi:GntR family transcriptional regulator [Guptibacillus hwajinpoensis]|uniref:GntR family transcriptional regulator n=1 Tax=Guptibacillus hwajinpoensis TaxID=208199 RepID=A0ABU0JZW4_9BACL|nr:GntR family transcriptional regulator [Alkalihalobacillus hemicentroti]MDQ0482641.1 GntR family transcriptional regulator [Alkalihalobacillus hemicentroti]
MLTIDPESTVPIYLQLRNEIMEAIARGDLSKGDTLPSVRALAGDLGVNMHTVNKSYHELVSKEIIEIVPKKGAVVIVDEGVSNQRLALMSAEFRPLLAEALVRGMKEEELQRLITTIMNNIKEE